jgi:hypothetical protein
MTHDLVLSRLGLRRFPDPVSVPVLACFMGISRHPGPVDLAALHPLLHAGQATLAAARITAKIGAALFGAGYASDASFSTACDPELSTSRSPDKPGRLTDGKTPSTRKHLLAKMAARLDHFGPSRVPAAAPPDSGRFKKHKGASR